MQRLIILRGCVASGKSTIAKRFRNFKNKTVWLKVDNFKDFFDSFDIEVRPYVHSATNATLDYFLKEGFSAVLDGVFQNPIFIDNAVEVAKKYKILYRVFQLKVSLKTLQERDKKREGVPEGHRKPLGDVAIAVIYNRLEENPYPGAITLDTENLSIDEAVNFINQQF